MDELASFLRKVKVSSCGHNMFRMFPGRKKVAGVQCEFGVDI